MRAALAGLIFTLWAGVSNSALATDYYMIGQSSRTAELLDLSNINRDGDTVLLWQITLYKHPLKTPSGSVDFVETRFELDCSAARFHLVSLAAYNGADQITQGTPDDTAWRDIIPETQMVFAKAAVCEATSPRADYPNTDAQSLLSLYRSH